MQQTQVSVVVPAYNHARYVVEAVESVLAQDIDGLECIVIDDASTDDTRERLATLDDTRVRVMHHDTNRGAHATLTEGLDAARGRVLAVLNSDDRYLPGRLAECMAYIDAGHDLVGSDIRLIDGDGAEVLEHWWIDAFAALKRVRADGGDWVASLLEGNVFMTTSNMVFTRALWQRLRPLRNLRYVHDYDFVLRALREGARLDWIDTPLLDYRLHEANTISAGPLAANLECTALLREHLPALLARTDAPETALQHLASQWSRCERYEVDILRALQHEALVEKDRDWGRMVEDRDRWIAERDAWIAERDAWIAERDRRIRDRDDWIVERDMLIATLRVRLDELHRTPLRYAWRRTRERLGHLRSRAARAFSAMQLPGRRAPTRAAGFNALRGGVERAGAGLSAISFDVFDTLVERCVEPPEWIHRRVAHELANALARDDIDTVWAARRNAETRLRKRALEDGRDHECHYDELLHAWVTELCGRPDAALIARAQDFEARLERHALRAKPGAAAFLAWARERGLRCIAVSDMYLGESHVREILAHCGLGESIDAVHVSSEHGLAKYSTRLHAHVLELEGLTVAQVLHVGDNLYSDALAPCRIGMHGVWFDDARARRRRRRQRRSAQMTARGGIWPGRMQAEIVAERLALEARTTDADPYYRYGLEVLGPIFSLFTLGLVERLRARPADRLMFLARDGHLFMRMYARWRELDDDDALPEPSYVYASRRVVASAAVADGLTAAMIPIALANPKQCGLASILKTYGLLAEDFQEAAARHGLQPIDAPLAAADDERLTAFLADDAVQAAIRTHGRRARTRLEKYFEQQGFFGSRDVAFVDIGWNGTIQHFLAESFGTRADYPDVAGYYFALVNSFHTPGERCGLTDGLLLDGKRGNPCERAAMDFEELFEQGARALEATTLSYDEDADGRVIPVLKGDDAPDRREELACNPRIDALQRGVLAHLEHFHAAQTLTGFDFEALRPYGLALIERAVVYPERDEVALVGGLAHSEDFGHDHVLDISGGDIGWRDFLRPRRLSQRLRAQAWRYAPFARFRNPLPALLARVQHLRQLRGRP